ncbi:MAG: glycosyltransferase, partial [Spirochaetota bacterium]
MRIAFPTTEYVTESSYAGGLANYLQRIAGALRDLGHEVHVIVVSDAHPGSFESDGIRVHRLHRRHAARPLRLLKAGSAHKDAWMSRLVSQRLAGLHRVHGFDAVQYPSYRALALKRLRGVPAVVRISSHRRLWNRAGVGAGS